MRKLVSFLVFCTAIIVLTLTSIDSASGIRKEFETVIEEKIVLEPLENSLEKNKEDEWSANEIYMMAKLVMAEAEGESVETKAMVVQVVLNRVADEEFPNNIIDVIYDEGQFTPVSDGRFNRVEPNQECYDAIKKIKDSEIDVNKDILYFETVTDKKTWHSENLQFLFQSGNLNFYR